MAKKYAAAVIIFLAGVCMLLYFFSGAKYFKPKTITDNPATGFAVPALSANAENAKLIYVNLTWQEWEPQKGEYAYTALEEKYHFAKYRAAGKHLVLRLVCDMPSAQPHMDIPTWLYDETQDGAFYSTEYGEGYCPNYDNTAFIAAHKSAINALGEYMSRDTFCLYVELGSLGHWGEWHTKSDAEIPHMPNADICADYVQPYVDSFKNAKLLMRRPFEFVGKYNMGVYNDMTGSAPDTNEWLNWLKNSGEYDNSNIPQRLIAVNQIWNTAPVGGEFTSSLSFAYMLGTNFDETISLIKKSHMTFIGPNYPQISDKVSAEAIEKIKAELGYGYRISKLKKRGDTFTLTWVNDGAAPLYWDWPVTLCALDKDNNVIAQTDINIRLSQLAPNAKMQTTSTTVANAAAYAVAITDTLTKKPSVLLSMDCDTVNGMSIIYKAPF